MLQKSWKCRAAIFITLGMLVAIILPTFTSVKALGQTPSPTPPKDSGPPQTQVNDQITDQNSPALDGSVNRQNSRTNNRQNQNRASTTHTGRTTREYINKRPVICLTPLGRLIPWKCGNR